MLKKILNRSLQVRFTFTLWLISAASCVVAGFVTSLWLQSRVEEIARDQIRSTTKKLIEVGLVDLGAFNEYRRLPGILKNVLALSRTEYLFRVFDQTGMLIYSNVPEDEVQVLNLDLAEGVLHQPLINRETRPNTITLIEPYLNADGLSRFVQVVQAMPRYRNALLESWAQYGLVLCILFVSSLLVSWVLSRRLLRPIEKVADHLSQLSPDDIRSWRPIVETDDRAFLHDIIASANKLISNLQKTFLASHNLARFVAHEVRTPLTMMLGDIEMAKRKLLSPEDQAKMFEVLSNDITKLDRIISTILELANRERGANPYRPELLEIVPLMKRAILDFEKAHHRVVQSQFNIDADFKMSLDPNLLLLLVDNLLRNSLKHGGSRAKVDVTVNETADTRLCIQVRDSGPGLNDEMLAAFNRAEIPQRSGGIGMGLPLALEIAKISGWQLQFQNLNPGLQTSIIFPKVSKILENFEDSSESNRANLS